MCQAWAKQGWCGEGGHSEALGWCVGGGVRMAWAACGARTHLCWGATVQLLQPREWHMVTSGYAGGQEKHRQEVLQRSVSAARFPPSPNGGSRWRFGWTGVLWVYLHEKPATAPSRCLKNRNIGAWKNIANLKIIPIPES